MVLFFSLVVRAAAEEIQTEIVRRVYITFISGWAYEKRRDRFVTYVGKLINRAMQRMSAAQIYILHTVRHPVRCVVYAHSVCPAIGRHVILR